MPDHIVCLEDGKKLKMLKRYLRSNYDMTPEDYRAKWGLAADYPMVAPNYAAQRSAFAKKIGLGRKGSKKIIRRRSTRQSRREGQSSATEKPRPGDRIAEPRLSDERSNADLCSWFTLTIGLDHKRIQHRGSGAECAL